MSIRRIVHGHGLVMCLFLGVAVFGSVGTHAIEVAAGGVRSTASPLPATGHAEVIAQSIVSFGDGAYHWAVLHETLAVGDDDVDLSLVGPVFLVTEGGVIDLDSAVPARFASGEAAFLAAGSESVLHAVEAEPVIVVIALVGDLMDAVTPIATEPATSVAESDSGNATSASSDVPTSTTASATSTSTTGPLGSANATAPVDTGTVQAQLPTIPPDTGTVQAELPVLQLDDDEDGLSTPPRPKPAPTRTTAIPTATRCPIVANCTSTRIH